MRSSLMRFLFRMRNNFFFDFRNIDTFTEYVGDGRTAVEYTVCGYIEKDVRVIAALRTPDVELTFLERIFYFIFRSRNDDGELDYFLQKSNFDFTPVDDGESQITNSYYSILSQNFGQNYMDICFCELDEDEMEEWKVAPRTAKAMEPFKRQCTKRQEEGRPKCHTRDAYEVSGDVPEGGLWLNGVNKNI